MKNKPSGTGFDRKQTQNSPPVTLKANHFQLHTARYTVQTICIMPVAQATGFNQCLIAADMYTAGH